MTNDWRITAMLTKQEWQGLAPFCTTFAALNAYELLRLDLNLSDRYLGVISGTTRNGNTFAKVLAAFKDIGVVDEKQCPWKWYMRTCPQKTWDKIFDLSGVAPTAPRRTCRGYERIEETIEAIGAGLDSSPVMVSIGTNFGLHAVVVLAVTDSIHVWDSVPPRFKALPLETTIKSAWIYSE